MMCRKSWRGLDPLDGPGPFARESSAGVLLGKEEALKFLGSGRKR
jgi:hypothetical protein